MKRNPYRAAFAAMFVALAVACSPSDKPLVDVNVKVDAAGGAEATLKAAMDADTAFAAMAKSEGLKPAFLKYMHPTDSEFLQPGAVVTGAAAIAAGFEQSPPDFKIDWAPDGGHGSASGDLAVTTGLFTISAGGQPIEKGRYVTVWSKDEAGELKAVMDMSVPDPAQAAVSPTLDKPDLEGRPG